MELKTSGKIYLASMAMYGKKNSNGKERPPSKSEWERLLTNGNLALPRDKTPTSPKQTDGPLIYGRVAGVQEGSRWVANIVDEDENLNLPPSQGGPGGIASLLISPVKSVWMKEARLIYWATSKGKDGKHR
jgi:hypothetical protein